MEAFKPRRKEGVNMNNIKLVCRVFSQLGLDYNGTLDADGTGELYVYDGSTWLGTISFVGGELIDWE